MRHGWVDLTGGWASRVGVTVVWRHGWVSDGWVGVTNGWPRVTHACFSHTTKFQVDRVGTRVGDRSGYRPGFG